VWYLGGRMTTHVHDMRHALREALTAGRRVVGTFVKLATPDAVELAALAGFDLVVVDLEHSTLSEAEAIALVRHADVVGIPALVRLPAVDPPAIARLLENGAVGIQLSMLQTARQSRALRAASRFPPQGGRSMSLANRVAGFGAGGVAGFLATEAASPPLLIGQIETAVEEPVPDVIAGLDVVFVGTTDLAVSLGCGPGDERLAAAVTAIGAAATAAGVAFGGWVPSLASAGELSLSDATYLVVGSDLQILASGLRAAATEQRGTT
jgi:4-hydroxy-2-oxoheptanedioate aldolase